jgi:hypothetical protein
MCEMNHAPNVKLARNKLVTRPTVERKDITENIHEFQQLLLRVICHPRCNKTLAERINLAAHLKNSHLRELSVKLYISYY